MWLSYSSYCLSVCSIESRGNRVLCLLCKLTLVSWSVSINSFICLLSFIPDYEFLHLCDVLKFPPRCLSPLQHLIKLCFVFDFFRLFILLFDFWEDIEDSVGLLVEIDVSIRIVYGLDWFFRKQDCPWLLLNLRSPLETI